MADIGDSRKKKSSEIKYFHSKQNLIISPHENNHFYSNRYHKAFMMMIAEWRTRIKLTS